MSDISKNYGVPEQWQPVLSDDILEKAGQLYRRGNRERQGGAAIWPQQHEIFRALELTPPDNLKAVIIGQDPYHTPGQANGLAFSINPGNPLQPSVQNIFKELADDIGAHEPASGDLTLWAQRGVLLLNTTLTVYQGRPNSCADWGWQEITLAVIKACMNLPQPVVYIAWGSPAKKLIDQLDFRNSKNKHAIWSTHPSPFSALRASSTAPAFMGSKPFSRTNQILAQYGVEPIDWTLP